jgi:site-specific DNA-methyltransferase (adenine-specific)
VTQHVTPDRFRFVPQLDMKKRWTDGDLYKEFRLTSAEVDYVEATIKPRSINLSLDSPIPSSHLPGGSKYRIAEELDADEDFDE